MPVLTDASGWFTIEIPRDWRRETLDGVTTLRSPLGIGVIYFSAGRRLGGARRGFGGADFLCRFLRSLGIALSEDSIVCSEWRGCLVCFYCREAEDLHWRYWSVSDDETALLISYNCPVEDTDTETDAVDEIVRSVRLFPSPVLH